MFLTSGSLNEKILNEIGFNMLGRGKFMTFIITISAAVALGISEIVFAASKYYILWFAMAAVLFIELFMTKRSYVKSNLEHMIENEGAPEYLCSTAFSDRGLLMRNDRTNKATYVRFEALVDIVKLDSVFALFTDKRGFACVFRNALSKEDEKNFIRYLKSKPTSIKWRRKGRLA